MLSETFLNINISFQSCECFPVIDSIYFNQFIADPILFSSKTPRPRGVKCDMRNRNRKFFLREAILEGFFEMKLDLLGRFMRLCRSTVGVGAAELVLPLCSERVMPVDTKREIRFRTSGRIPKDTFPGQPDPQQPGESSEVVDDRNIFPRPGLPSQGSPPTTPASTNPPRY